MKLMPIINEAGEYAYVPGTKVVDKSNHPVYQARIEIALGINKWVGDPSAGSNLERFKDVRESEHQIDEFQKELAFYLQSYNPTLVDTIIETSAVQTDLSITEDALDAVVQNTN